MNTRARKVVRDFWQERTRSMLVVLAIALGIAAFSAVLSSYAILNRELNDGYLATNPASFNLRTGALGDEVVRLIAQSPGVGAAEPRRVVAGRIKAGPAQWRGVMLFVVKDYADIRVSTLRPETGAWPPGPGEMLIERDAFQVAKAKVGDRVTIKTPKGDFVSLQVTGGVHDVGQAQARMENTVYGYITLETLALLGEEPYLDQLKVLVSGDRFDREHIGRVADDVKRLLESQGLSVGRVEIPDPGKHPHADLMGMLLLAISSFGLLVLALSGVLVVNLLTALMASQVRQIGMMKAIGGSRAQIAQIYFGQALLLGVSAVVVGVPVGVLGGRALCRYLAVFLNFDLTSFAVPMWVYGLVALVGLATPLLAAAVPVWKGSGVSVWAALADFGVSDRGFGTGRLDRALTHVSGLARPLLLAIRNSFRRRTRLALTLLTLAVGGLFFMAALNIRASMINTIDTLFATKRFDLSLNLGGMFPLEAIERAMSRTPGVVRFEGWIVSDAALVAEGGDGGRATGSPHARGAGGGHAGGTARRFPVLGVQPETEMLKLDIGEGRDLRPDETDALVANTALTVRHPEIRVGRTVVLRTGPSETTWRVVGIAREAFSPPTAYVSRDFFERAGHTGMANNARVALARTDVASIDAFREVLDRNLEAEGIRALSTLSTAESRYGFDQHMLMVYIFLVVMSVIIGAVGGLGLMTTMSLNVLERRREMGVLRAIGASSRVVWLIVVAEGLTIGLMSFGLAATLAGPVSRILGDFIANAMFRSGLNFLFDPNGLWIWLVASSILSVVSSFLPAWNASRSSVREALGFE
ncbi:MAG: FtsX-like permease family protein [Vicinamibacteria bacterium]|nr:FtsX-like permease family protein [Vicinamibacteria bacterium]